jgi:hypothetical protein
VAAARGLLPDSQTYETEQFAFDYPGGWREIEGVEFFDRRAGRPEHDGRSAALAASWPCAAAGPRPAPCRGGGGRAEQKQGWRTTYRLPEGLAAVIEEMSR